MVRLPTSLSINPGFVFYGMSQQVRDDDGTPSYGGLFYAYTNTSVRMYAPNRVRLSSSSFLENYPSEVVVEIVVVGYRPRTRERD
jgi:hypothetical protein